MAPIHFAVLAAMLFALISGGHSEGEGARLVIVGEGMRLRGRRSMAAARMLPTVLSLRGGGRVEGRDWDPSYGQKPEGDMEEGGGGGGGGDGGGGEVDEGSGKPRRRIEKGLDKDKRGRDSG